MSHEQTMLSEAELKAEIQRLARARQLASFDFAIKFLLKDKSSHETISGVLTTLLTLAGYSPVQITCFEDPESNIEHPGQKRSVVDLKLRGSQGEIYLMEVQRLTSYKVHRKCIFSTSRATVDHIPVGAAYDKLNKVFHISILYFIPDA